jgi:hypothetical protein
MRASVTKSRRQFLAIAAPLLAAHAAFALPWTLAPTTEPAATAPATQPATAPADITAGGTTTPIAPPPPAADTPIGPTSSFQALEAGVANKQYRDVLLAISRILSLPESQKPTFDRYPYLMLRAECALQLKNASLAETTLEAALKATPGKDEKAIAQATDLLIKHSTGFKYLPQHTTDKDLKRGVDILDKTSRQLAFAAMLDDQMAAVALQVKQAMASKSLVVIVNAATVIAPLPALEFAATGKRDRTAAAYAELGKHAQELMDGALTSMADSTTRISADADRIVTVNVNLPGGQQMTKNARQGLANGDRQILSSTVSTCNQLVPAAEKLQQALQLDGDPFKDILDRAKKVHDDAVQAITKG